MVFSSGSCYGAGTGCSRPALAVMLWVPLGTGPWALLTLNQALTLSQDAGDADGISWA